MSTIVFHVLQCPSHLNSSFKIAKRLKSRGHRIVYFNFIELKGVILSQGFEFFSIPSNHYLNQGKLKKSKVQKFFQLNRSVRYYSREFLKGNFYDDILGAISPDLFIIDLSLIYYSVFLFNKAPFLITCTKVSLNKSDTISPISFTFFPIRCNVLSKVFIKILWKFELMKFKIIQIYYFLRPDKVSHYFLVKKFLKSNKVNLIESIDNNRSLHFGLKDIPELILSPKSFDFPRYYGLNQIHIGPVVDLERKELGYDQNFDCIWQDIEFKIKKNSFKLIYCSLGSYTSEFIKLRISFYIKVIKVFMKMDNVILILSTGNKIIE